MHIGQRYSFLRTLRWSSKPLILFIIYDTLAVTLHAVAGFEWLHLPWQPISLVGIAVAFYLGFKNNSSYDRLWEARKIWGGIVNASRSFTVMTTNFVNNTVADQQHSDEQLYAIKKRIVHRHVAWLHCLTYELRKLKNWEHTSDKDQEVRDTLGVKFSEDKYDNLKSYISQEDHDYIMTKEMLKVK